MTSKTTHRRLIAVDFDGVLHSYSSPWTDAATISDGPTPGAMKFLEALVDDERFDVVIVSSRLSQHDGGVAVFAWLRRHLVAACGEVGDDYADSIRLSAVRPPAFVTIDDRGWQFNGTWPDLDRLAAFKPWNKGSRHAASDDAEALENDSIEADVRDILGPFGAVTPLLSLQTDLLVGWAVFNGALTIERSDMPVDGDTRQNALTRLHRRSILETIAAAYKAGRSA